MITKIKDAMNNLIFRIERVTAQSKATLAPMVRVGVIITAVYSVVMSILVVLCGFLGFSMEWLMEFPGIDFIANIMLVISMVTLVLSGSIIEALRILLYAIEFGLRLASIPSCGYSVGSFFVSLAIAAVFFVLPLILAGLVIVFAPIVPILLHRSRKTNGNWYD